MMANTRHKLEVISIEEVKIPYKSHHTVLRDASTGVLYHYIDDPNKCTITPVIDADGKPVVYKPEE